jgi:hypothetical protein
VSRQNISTSRIFSRASPYHGERFQGDRQSRGASCRTSYQYPSGQRLFRIAPSTRESLHVSPTMTKAAFEEKAKDEKWSEALQAYFIPRKQVAPVDLTLMRGLALA